MATIERAVEIAAIVHAGIMDKAGKEPYLFHPLRIMMKMTSDEARIVGVLHDVVEESRLNPPETKWTFERLLKDEGFTKQIVDAVMGVTDRKGQGESYEMFVERASKNPISREVKIADLEDNMNMLRLSRVEEKQLERLGRYHRSWLFLTERSPATASRGTSDVSVSHAEPTLGLPSSEENLSQQFEDSLGIPRAEMPQISRTHLPDFLKFAEDNGVSIKPEKVGLVDLKPTQNEFNPKQAAQLPDATLRKPLMVSNDNRVLDGHNIYTRLMTDDPTQEVEIRRIDLPAREALKFMKSFPKTTYKPVEHVGTAAKLAEHRTSNPIA